MRTRTVKAIAATAVLTVVTAVAGCSSDSPEENEAAACAAYESFVGALSGAQETVNSSATVGEIKTARDTLAASYKTLADALSDVASDRQGEIDDAWKKLDSAVSNLADDQTAADAAGSLTDEFQAVTTAQEGAASSLNCG